MASRSAIALSGPGNVESVAPPGGNMLKESTADESEAQSPRDRVVKEIIRGLYGGTFEPGQRLIEAQLTEDYGVSRGPVREALNRLAAMGVIDLTQQRGAQVRILSVDEAIDILVVAQRLVGLAANLAAANIDRPGARAQLDATLGDLMGFDQTSSSAAYAVARDAFYGAITSIAGNAELSRILPSVQIHLIRIQFRAILRSVDRRRHKDYLAIADAIMAGDARKADRLAQSHIGRGVVALRTLSAKNDAG